MINKVKLPFSSFVIKILALLTMTIDHLGLLLCEFNYLSSSSPIYQLLRGTGRLALPLFCFMIAQGALHTRSIKKYCLRLGILASAISLAMIIMEYTPIFKGYSIRSDGIIFLDLLLGALTIYLLKQKSWYIKALSILIIAYSILSTISANSECVSCGKESWLIPFFMRTQYGFYGVLMIVGVYLFIEYGNNVLSKYHGAYDSTTTEILVKNIGSVIAIALSTFIYFIFQTVQASVFNLNYVYDPEFQLFALFSIPIILLYNGRRGYNAKWFQYGSYLYYLVHIILLYLIFMLLSY